MKQLVVNKEDLKHNINRIKDYTKKISNDDNYTIIAVVKGNGYGLGLNEYSEVLVENGIKYLAVATFEEAIELRKKQKDVNILMMSPLYNKQELEETVKSNITIAIDSKENADAVNELANKGYNIKVHLKIDTGFGRYGFIYDDFENILNTVQSLKPNVEIEGIFTHCSDAYRKNNKHTLEQFKRFTDVIEKLEANNIKIKLKHICNSPAILNYPEMHLTAARIGSAFVGRVCSENNIGLKKIGELEINIAEVKDIPKGFNISYLNSYKTKDKTRIAIIPIGYLEGYNVTQKTDMFRIADKLRRALHELKSIFKKQKITVVINEKRYNVIGTIRNVPYNSWYYRK
mgnify:FL=1